MDAPRSDLSFIDTNLSRKLLSMLLILRNNFTSTFSDPLLEAELGNEDSIVCNVLIWLNPVFSEKSKKMGIRNFFTKDKRLMFYTKDNVLKDENEYGEKNKGIFHLQY
jgi:hypothetical protein